MVLIAIGANLPAPDGAGPLETCHRAVAALQAIAGYDLVGLSRWYESAPVPPSGQPPYVNGVARLSGPTPYGPCEPERLLHTLQAIEQQAGRVRGAPNAARTLDLDIVAIGDLIRAAPDPVLPHPRAHQRAFVLVPLADVAPKWVHPVLRQPVASLIAALPPQPIRPL
jgi:2-amino-4-hydroxy-6-hydroxymethyldihydropteridine diphosphokinase